MEHARRWGLAGRLRAAAPLPVSWSQDVSFCTTFLGREITRFTGVLGLADDGDSPERGQQLPQAHTGLNITDDAFDKVAEHLRLTLLDLDVDRSLLQIIMGFVEGKRSQVVMQLGY